MMSTQRIIIMIIALNLVIGFAVSVSNDRSSITAIPTEFTDSTNFSENILNVADNENTKWGGVIASSDDISGSTFGNQIRMQSLIWEILGNSLNPFSIPTENMETNFEKTLGWGLEFFRVLMGIILVLEIVLLIWGKKTT